MTGPFAWLPIGPKIASRFVGAVEAFALVGTLVGQIGNAKHTGNSGRRAAVHDATVYGVAVHDAAITQLNIERFGAIFFVSLQPTWDWQATGTPLPCEPGDASPVTTTGDAHRTSGQDRGTQERTRSSALMSGAFSNFAAYNNASFA
jgi:hypothetical protein